MKRLSLLIWGLICLGVVPTLAADCPALVQQAFAATDRLCHETGRNKACYGNINLKAQPSTDAADFRFDKPGDRVDIGAIKSLQLSPMAVDRGEWGVALMNIQASVAARPADLTLLAFGDVTLENATPAPTAVDVHTAGSRPINLRALPNANSSVIGTLKPDQMTSAIERLSDSSWVRVTLPNSSQAGWTRSDLLGNAADLSTLNVVDGSQPHYGPMQAFTFKSGTAAQGCAEVPQDGLIIQTPEGSGEVQLWINQVVVKLGSTVYFQAQAGGDMVVTTVEGHATVNAMGVTQTAYAGSSVHIPMDANMNPSGPPGVPLAYQMAEVSPLPIEHLQRKISIHAPLTAQELATEQNQNKDCPGNSCHNGTNNNNGNGNNDCAAPPCSDNANSTDCPGNSCHNGTNNNNGNGGNNGNGNGNSSSNGNGKGNK